ncbi:MAG: efflux transporter outer membrane subunit, partial [Desulfovibrionaceae bacterium]
MRTLILTTVLSLLAGCVMFAPDERASAPASLPGSYLLQTGGQAAPERWWTAFHSTELDRLVDAALSRNFDIRTAMARLRQAYAVARKTSARLYPTVDAEAAASQKRTYKQTSRRADHDYAETEAYSLGLAAAYEVDLWGRLRSFSEADRLEALATRQDYESAAMTVAASVASVWTDLLAVRREIAILKEQVKTNETILDLQELRFANGLSVALDVSQQREVLAGTQAELPVLQAREQLLLNSLALLLGSASPDELDVEQSELPAPPPLPAAGLPVDLLENRPDVRAAGLRLSSADWEVSAARADRLPSLTLSAEAALSSAQFSTILTNWMTNIAGGLAAPVFDAGLRKAEVDRTRAVADEKLADYARTVVTAVKEVQDALASEHHQTRYIQRLEEQLRVARITLAEARLRYLKGLSDYLTYIAELTSVQSLERQLIRERAQLIAYRVDLYRALGGDWTRELKPSA